MGNGIEGLERNATLREDKLGERRISQSPGKFQSRAVGGGERPAHGSAYETARREERDTPPRAASFHDLTQRALDAVAKIKPALEARPASGERLPVHEQGFEHALKGPQAVALSRALTITLQQRGELRALLPQFRHKLVEYSVQVKFIEISQHHRLGPGAPGTTKRIPGQLRRPLLT